MCLNVVGSYQCHCPDGYEGDGGLCCLTHHEIQRYREGLEERGPGHRGSRREYPGPGRRPQEKADKRGEHERQEERENKSNTTDLEQNHTITRASPSTALHLTRGK